MRCRVARGALDACGGDPAGLPPAETGALEAHLRGCPACTARRLRLLVVGEALRSLPDPPIPGGSVLPEVLASIRRAGTPSRPAWSLAPRWALAASAAAAIALVWLTVSEFRPIAPARGPADRADGGAAGARRVPTASASRAAPPLRRHESVRSPAPARGSPHPTPAAPADAGGETIAVATPPAAFPIEALAHGPKSVAEAPPGAAGRPAEPTVSSRSRSAGIVARDRAAVPDAGAPTLAALQSAFHPGRGERAHFVLRGRGATATARIVGRDGRAVRTIFSGELSTGALDLFWDGTTDHGRPAPSGVYHLLVSVGGRTLREKVLLAR